MGTPIPSPPHIYWEFFKFEDPYTQYHALPIAAKGNVRFSAALLGSEHCNMAAAWWRSSGCERAAAILGSQL
ncbi:hypothetical protein GBA52_026912 [Prunus armeniaca]|nr:hypothetical protein GBA52_026912 [Prunus armeniaca]